MCHNDKLLRIHLSENHTCFNTLSDTFGKVCDNRESDYASGVYKAHYSFYYVQNGSMFVSLDRRKEISF